MSKHVSFMAKLAWAVLGLAVLGGTTAFALTGYLDRNIPASGLLTVQGNLSTTGSINGNIPALNNATSSLHSADTSMRTRYEAYSTATKLRRATFHQYSADTAATMAGKANLSGASFTSTVNVTNSSQGSTSRAIYGFSSYTSGLNYGVYGQAAGTQGYGIYGYASNVAGLNYGVRGATASASGYGGYFAGGLGLYGSTVHSGDGLYDGEYKIGDTRFRLFSSSNKNQHATFHGKGAFSSFSTTNASNLAAKHPWNVFNGYSGRQVTRDAAQLPHSTFNDYSSREVTRNAAKANLSGASFTGLVTVSTSAIGSALTVTNNSTNASAYGITGITQSTAAHAGYFSGGLGLYGSKISSGDGKLNGDFPIYRPGYENFSTSNKAAHDTFHSKTAFSSYTGQEYRAKTFGGNVNFAKFKAIALACDNGATLPASPAVGQWFLHTPTGREVLCQWTGTEWETMFSFGTTTLYVDGASGTDSADKGYGTGANAFATIQYAVDSIGDMYCGNVVINIASGTYREMVTIQGKTPCGNYTITLQGAWTTTLANTTATSAADRTSATANASITKTGAGWTVNACQYKMLYIVSGTGSGQYRPILSNTSDTIYVEAWATTPDNTSHFVVYDWATRITGSDAGADTTSVRANCVVVDAGQLNCVISGININYATFSGIYMNSGSFNTQVVNCNINNVDLFGIYLKNTAASMSSSYVSTNLFGMLQYFSTLAMYDTVFNANTLYGSWVQAGGLLYHERDRYMGNGSGAEGANGGAFEFTDTPNKTSFDSNTTGINLEMGSGSRAVLAQSQFFNGNTTDFANNGNALDSGKATLSGGTVTVTNSNVTANSLILLTTMPGGTNVGYPRVSTITAGTSFVITSSNGSDNSPVAWQIVTQ